MNRRLQKHEDRKKALVAHSTAILDAAERESRELTPAERLLLDSNTAELDDVNGKIDEELAKAVHLDGPAWGPNDVADMLSRPLGDGSAYSFDPPSPGGISMHGTIGGRYRDLFGKQVSNGGWKSQQDFLSAIYSGMSHPNLVALNEGSGVAGGFLVPTEYAAEMLDNAMENSIVMPRARVYPMKSDTKRIAGFDASTNTSTTLFGGITSDWLAEEGTGTVANPVVRKIELKAKKLALFTSTSNEVAEDGMGLEGQLTDAMTSANGWFLDYAFLRGSGAGQPLGVLNDPALVTVDAEGDQDADSIVYENCIKMLARLHPGCFKNAVWVANPTCIPQLLSLSTTIGISGTPVPVLKETDGGWSLLTRPMLFTEKLPVVGDKGDIMLCDFSQYAIGLRKEVTLEKSAHILFMSDQTVWRAITRIDGQGRWNTPFTPANGSTQSWCVALAARA